MIRVRAEPRQLVRSVVILIRHRLPEIWPRMNKIPDATIPRIDIQARENRKTDAAPKRAAISMEKNKPCMDGSSAGSWGLRPRGHQRAHLIPWDQRGCQEPGHEIRLPVKLSALVHTARMIDMP